MADNETGGIMSDKIKETSTLYETGEPDVEYKAWSTPEAPIHTVTSHSPMEVMYLQVLPDPDQALRDFRATWYTLQEALEVLKIGRTTLWKWMKQGRLREQRIGYAAFFRKVEVQALDKETSRS